MRSEDSAFRKGSLEPSSRASLRPQFKTASQPSVQGLRGLSGPFEARASELLLGSTSIEPVSDSLQAPKFHPRPWAKPGLNLFRSEPLPCRPGNFCNLLRPLMKILFLLVPYGYILIKIKKNS